MKAIEFLSLTKKYNGVPVVDHLDFSVEEGELVALLGVNGAGKTTAIKMLSALIPPSEGDAKILGHSVVKESLAAKQLLNISPQETAVAPNLSVWENLCLIARIYGFSKAEANEKAEEMVKTFSLEEVRRKKAGILSGGWQRRLSIAMALISSPKVLFLDEPTLGLDVLARRELWNFIESLKGKITILLTTHYLEEAHALSDRVAIMEKGKLRAFGTAEEIMTLAGKDNFEEAFITLVGKGGETK